MKKLLFSLVFTLVCLSGQSTHLIGGNFEVIQTGANAYSVGLRIFRNCKPGAVPLATPQNVRVYLNSNNSLFTTFNYAPTSGSPVTVGDACYSPDLCVEEYFFNHSLSLPNQPGGYYFVWTICCRNAGITNIVSTGSDAAITFYTSIPDPSLAGGNSSPVFGNYPSDGYLCVNSENNMQWAYQDPDGDQLVYSLVEPLAENNGPKPFQTVVWNSGYSLSNILGNSPPMSINPSTGELTAQPGSIGLYVFAVRIEEFRNGQKIGETIRDVQYQSLACSPPAMPQITSPTTMEFTAELESQLCFPIAATIVNNYNLNLIVESPLLSNGKGNFSGSGSGNGTVGGVFCLTPRCSWLEDADRSFPVRITAWTEECSSADSVFWEGVVNIQDPSKLALENFPNVVTPNGDDNNDAFFLTDVSTPCEEKFSIIIFNRWGTSVFESTTPDFVWNCTDKSGSPVAEGVYFFVIKSEVAGQPKEFKHHLTVFR